MTVLGTVFDIKEFSVHDGPGVRTTVFMKGCPLSCRWCHNPEGLSSEPELVVSTARCRRCGLCMRSCSHEDCKPYGRCLHICPDGLVSVAGKRWDAESLAKKILKNADFMKASGGGVTFSGGEPALQAGFLCEVLDRLTDVHKAIQTCGFCSSEHFSAILERVDYVMMDIKLADRGAHREWCGADNRPILENFKILRNSEKPYTVRVPLIPDITDTEDNLKAISEIVGDSPVELLPYNPFAGAKYESVGRTYELTAKENRKIDLSIFKNAILRV